MSIPIFESLQPVKCKESEKRATLITSCYTVCGEIGKEVRSSTEASSLTSIIPISWMAGSS